MVELGSLTKEFPLEDVEKTIALAYGGQRYAELRAAASLHTNANIPALLRNRFLLVENDTIVQDRFLELFHEEGVGSAKFRKVMYLTWALRDSRFRQFILEVVAGADGKWSTVDLCDKSKAAFFLDNGITSSEKASTKIRSNIEYFVTEAGIFEPRTQTIHLELDDHWLDEGVRIAAKSETDLAKRHAMVSAPVDFLLACGWNGLANATVTELRGLNRTPAPSIDPIDDDEIPASYPPARIEWDWSERRQISSVTRSTTVAQIDLVAHERANRSHRELEGLIASLIEAAGRTPKQNVNIDVFSTGASGSLLIEVKSCREDNLHAQVRRGVSQLFEYRFVYSDVLEEDVVLVLLIEIRPPATKAWLVHYLDSIGITMIWKSADGTRLETTVSIPQQLAGIVSKSTL